MGALATWPGPRWIEVGGVGGDTLGGTHMGGSYGGHMEGMGGFMLEIWEEWERYWSHLSVYVVSSTILGVSSGKLWCLWKILLAP